MFRFDMVGDDLNHIHVWNELVEQAFQSDQRTPDLSGAMRKRRIGTAKFFTLLLLLYHTSAKSQGMKQFMAN